MIRAAVFVAALMALAGCRIAAGPTGSPVASAQDSATGTPAPTAMTATPSPSAAAASLTPDPAAELQGVAWFVQSWDGLRYGTVGAGDPAFVPSGASPAPGCCGALLYGPMPWTDGPSSGMVAYALHDGTTFDLHVVSVADGGDVLVRSDDAMVPFGTLDPAGEQLFVVRADRELHHLGIWRLSVADGNAEQLAGLRPDGAVLAAARSGAKTGSAGGGDAAPIPEEPHYQGLIVTPDGERLLACGSRERAAALLVVELATETSRVLRDVPDILCPVAVSHDRAFYQVALEGGAPNAWQAIEVNLDDGRSVERAVNYDFFMSAVTDADGNDVLLYVSSPAEPFRVDALDLATGESRTVFEGHAEGFHLEPHRAVGSQRGFGIELPDGWFVLARFTEAETAPRLAVRIADGATVELPFLAHEVPPAPE